MIAPPKGGKNTIATFSPFTFYQKNRYLSIPFYFSTHSSVSTYKMLITGIVYFVRPSSSVKVNRSPYLKVGNSWLLDWNEISSSPIKWNVCRYISHPFPRSALLLIIPQTAKTCQVGKFNLPHSKICNVSATLVLSILTNGFCRPFAIFWKLCESQWVYISYRKSA